MQKLSAIATVAFLFLNLTACKSTPKEEPAATTRAYTAGNGQAQAIIEPRSGSAVNGAAQFVQSGSQVTLTVELSGLHKGTHGIHLHERGDCQAADASSAGSHWNPEGSPHGMPAGIPAGKPDRTSVHFGDIGNIQAGADKTASLTFTTDKWTVGTGAANDVVGKAIVVHAGEDDFTSQPAGNSGARVACGVVRPKR